MGEGDAASEKPESVENGNAEVGNRAKAVMDEGGEQDDGLKEMEGDKLDDMVEVEAQDMDGDKDEIRKSEEISEEAEDEKSAKEEEKEETAEKVEEENKSEEMEEDAEEKPKSSAEEKVEEGVDGVKGEEENPEEPKNEKGPKKRPRSNTRIPEENEKDLKTPIEEKTKQLKTSVDKEEPKAPAASTIERPVRERKSVERLIATIEKDSAKEFHFEKRPTKFGSNSGNSSMRSKTRTISAAAGDLSQSIHNLPHEQQLCFEGETLCRFLKLIQRDIELARALDANLPLKFWIKQHFAVGVNEVTRALERMPRKHVSKISSDEHFQISDDGSEASCVYLQAILLASDCNPRWLTKHLPALAASRNVPLIIVKDRKEGSLRLAELIKLKSTIAIGIKAKDNVVNQLIEKVLHGENIDGMEEA